MFTRYSDIDIPKNYSGNRFRKSQYEDTTMKTHENEMQGAINTSVSPTFKDRLNHSDYPANKLYQSHHNIDIVSDDINQPVNEQNSLMSDTNDSSLSEEAHLNYSINDSKNNSQLGISSILDYIKDIKSDDLLIILLIILLASDKASSNNDIIILLALLLTSK